VKISVVIPTYNREAFIAKAVESVLKQKCTADEIIVVDDGSTDQTKERLSAYNIRYIYQKNGGVSSARNRGIQVAKNEWIAFLDSDDLWDENKLCRQVEFHQQHPKLLLSQTREIWIRNGQRVNVVSRYEKPEEINFLNSIESCLITASSLLLHKKIFDEVGLFDETMVVCEDYDMWLRILKSYDIGLIEDRLISKIAGHDDQLSMRYFAMDLYRVKALMKHLLFDASLKSIIMKKLEILSLGAKKNKNFQLEKQLVTLYKQLDIIDDIAITDSRV
jgi:glycosyltransferase involved in cell wall biosynthesis